MQYMFKLYLKKYIPGDDELWYCILNRWYNQKSTIIEIKSFIRDFYNNNHEINMLAENFTYEVLMKNLQVSLKTVHDARKHHYKNGSGCKALDKPIIVRKQMAEIKEREFELFFADKANVNMSSYHINKKTQLPVLYLKDQKIHLQNGRFKYHDDLGGLCLICNDYAYQLFEDLIKLVLNNIINTKMKNKLITQLEMLRRHLKKNYENELLVHDNGITKHVDYINHCLLHAFGECVEQHFLRCAACDELFEVFATLSHLLGHSYNTLLSEYQEKLTCYLAHQIRKIYLSAQFNAVLDKLDDHEAIIVVDYKMHILPATARETKSKFFGKKG
ncbi:hypothetical protein GLOIN_2v1767205 [Rhizophagus irregularis DAOM 181602=DAOM 197198]|nr:hypothetical protein GLOIN_2v1767205 [Rhizophagus irregularis DAOM 181602=DAOM 197198]